MTETAHEHTHGDDHGHGHGHGSPFIQHHYDDAKHQFDAGKLGIWFFLVQEILFFSGLFVLYILYRSHHGEIYEYAHHYLAVKWGAINTGVLIASSLSAAWAVRCAQRGEKKGLILCIVITIACAFGFLGVKYIEYSKKIRLGELYGSKFDPCFTPNETPLLTKSKRCPGTVSSVLWDDSANKAKSGCLAPGEYDRDPTTPGIQAQCTVDEVTFTGEDRKAEKSRHELEPCEMEQEKATGEWKPKFHDKKGGGGKDGCFIVAVNDNVCPDGPGVIALYPDENVRGAEIGLDPQCNKAPAATATTDVFAEPKRDTALGTKLVSMPHEKTDAEEVEELESSPPPPHTNMFFSIYFAMTGLHGLHVIVGILVFLWLLFRAVRGDFTPDYFGPVDYAALYWHLVDLIWIFLFPLLYLIH